MEPMYRNCSQNQARVNVSTIIGNANANHDAKFITSPFCGKSLQRTRPIKTIRLKMKKKYCS